MLEYLGTDHRERQAEEQDAKDQKQPAGTVEDSIFHRAPPLFELYSVCPEEVGQKLTKWRSCVFLGHYFCDFLSNFYDYSRYVANNKYYPLLFLRNVLISQYIYINLLVLQEYPKMLWVFHISVRQKMLQIIFWRKEDEREKEGAYCRG